MSWQVTNDPFGLMTLRLPDEEEQPAGVPAWRAAPHEGHLVLFFPAEWREGEKTRYGEADAVLCHKVVDLDTGAVEDDVLVFGSALTINIKVGIPESMVLGRLGKGVAVGGNNPPWILSKYGDEDEAKFEEWLKSTS